MSCNSAFLHAYGLTILAILALSAVAVVATPLLEEWIDQGLDCMIEDPPETDE